MKRYGNPPYLECSTRGDKRFCALHARIKKRGGKVIEFLYQSYKKFDRFPYVKSEIDPENTIEWVTNIGLEASNQAECDKFYAKLWDEYIGEHPELYEILQNSTGFSDIFGVPGKKSAAEQLWRIKNAEKI